MCRKDGRRAQISSVELKMLYEIHLKTKNETNINVYKRPQQSYYKAHQDKYIIIKKTHLKVMSVDVLFCKIM